MTTTLDRGDGNDSFQVGQMYGLTCDSLNACTSELDVPGEPDDEHPLHERRLADWG